MEGTGGKELAPGYTTSKWQIDSNASQSGSRIRLLNMPNNRDEAGSVGIKKGDWPWR